MYKECPLPHSVLYSLSADPLTDVTFIFPSIHTPLQTSFSLALFPALLSLNAFLARGEERTGREKPDIINPGLKLTIAAYWTSLTSTDAGSSERRKTS